LKEENNMSSFLPTVGRTVQYFDAQGIVNAAIITLVAGPVVDLKVFAFRDGAESHVKNVKPYVVGARASENTNCYLLHWQNR
jgi:hypothetical protein